MAIILTGGVLYIIYFRPTMKIPLPFEFVDKNKVYRKALLGNKDPQVLIIGDRMALRLSKYIGKLEELTSKGLHRPLEILSIASPYEGIHRTIHKLKEIEKLPPVIIYFGGSEEAYEMLSDPFEDKEVLYNLSKYQNPYIKTIIDFFPFTSKLIYKKVDLVKLQENDIKQNNHPYTETQALTYFEIIYKLYEIQLSNLIDYVQKKGSHLILMTVPLNLEVLPAKVCSGTTSNKIMLLQNRGSNLIKEKNYKEAYEELKKLRKLTPANALTFYLLGVAAKGVGKFMEAIGNLEQATALDCRMWRATAVDNSIIKKYAFKYDVYLLDFNSLVNRNLGMEHLFENKIYPQDVYFQEVVAILAQRIKKYLDI